MIKIVETLEQQIESLASRASAREQAANVQASPPELCEALASVDDVKEYTRQLFSAEPRVSLVFDPEFHDRSFRVAIQCHGCVDELVRKSDRWHRFLDQAAGRFSHLFSLSVTPLDEAD